MPLAARTRGRDRALGSRGTLMALCQAAGLPVASACSGRGACGRCLITVLSGAEALSRPGSRERRLLTRLGADPDQRISCQCRLLDPSAEVAITTGYW
ncbi:MAG: (2Fe-2S)-binding protein [Acidobacteriota bacterium]|nr:(2Fe-2S)-binding protein [Acidobacteriota bacterium]